MLKASLHVHIKGDHDDYIEYTGFELLDRAHALGYDIIAFTCHERVVFNEELQAHAKNLGILLIPGIEINVEGHILVLNAHPMTQFIKTPEELRAYRIEHPESFTIAAHPFFPKRKFCLQERIYKHLDLLDGIELSWFYSKMIDWNKKAKALAERVERPYIATSDIHLLEQLENGHVIVDCEKNIESFIEALRNKQFKSIAKPQGVFQMWWTFGKMLATQMKRFLPWSPPHIIFEHEKLSRQHQSQSQRSTKTDRVSRSV
ncbi:MAG: PHP-associated domain-containing protein [Candidatus Peregrinibacteria bacterium]|nr:PHP-associated domain-containing protein [Candidatus Peregrinibacteria bacterium]